MHDDSRGLLNGSIASMVIEIRVRKARIGSIYLNGLCANSFANSTVIAFTAAFEDW